MYKVEKILTDALINITSNIDPIKLDNIDNVNATKFFLFTDLKKDPQICSIEDLLKFNVTDDKVCFILCNIGIQLIRQVQLEKFIGWIDTNTTNDCIIIFNLLYNEGNSKEEECSKVMRNILIDELNKMNLRELSKHINFITRAFNSLPYWGSIFGKAKFKLLKYNKVDIDIDYKELEQFYLHTYDNNLLPGEMKNIWDEIIVESIHVWKSIHNENDCKWNFMPSINQKWYTVLFGR